MDKLPPKQKTAGSISGIIATGVFFLFIVVGCAQKAPTTPPVRPSGYPKPYKIGKNWYQPVPHARDFRQTGKASWYGKKFHGRKTANGETYDMYAITAAHKTLPFNTYVRVHNLKNGKTTKVRINDRGPFVRGRIIDLSYTAAKDLGVVGPGTAPVELVALGTAAAKTPQSGSEPKYIPQDYYTGNFTFQVGAFQDRQNAERLKEKLDPKYKNVHVKTFDNGSEIFYRVRVGKCSTLEKADEYERILADDGFKDAFIVAE